MKIYELFEKEEYKEDEEKTLYINRKLKNADEFIAWAKSNGFKSTLEPSQLHVTIAFSKDPVDWSLVEAQTEDVVCKDNDDRKIEQLGDQGAVVLRFECKELKERWQEIMNIGASWEHEGYKPHVTITYDPGETDYKNIEPYKGELIFSEEHVDEVDLDWAKKVKEK